MSFKQAAIIMSAVLLTVMSLLTPPCQYVNHHNSTERSAGYRFFTNPAKVKSDAEMRRIFAVPESDPPHYFTVRKNRLLMFCEWLAILFLAIGGIFLAFDRRTTPKILIGGFSAIVGLFFAVIVCVEAGTNFFIRYERLHY